MAEIRQVFLIAGQNFRGWKKSPRIFAVFGLALVLCLMLSDQMISRAIRYETTLQLAESYLWTFGDASSVMLSSFLLILLFADMPFVNGATPYTLVRTKRRAWLAGQMLYVIAVTTIYHLFLLLVLGAMSAPFAYVGNVWSKTAAMLGYGGSEGIVPVSVKTMESAMPYECAFWVFVLMLLYALFLAFVMMVCNLYFGNAAGVLGVFGINLYGLFLNPQIFQKLFHLTGRLSYRANVLCGWLSPLNHATFPMHNFGYDYLTSMGASISMFVTGILILGAVLDRKMKVYNFMFLQTDE